MSFKTLLGFAWSFPWGVERTKLWLRDGTPKIPLLLLKIGVSHVSLGFFLGFCVFFLLGFLVLFFFLDGFLGFLPAIFPDGFLVFVPQTSYSKLPKTIRRKQAKS